MQRSLRSRIFVSFMTITLLSGAIAGTPTTIPPHHAHAAVSYPSLGVAASFAVLGATTVTNTGLTTVSGDLGVSPGPSCTGFPSPCTGGPGAVSGTIHVADAVAAQAQADAASAYTLAAAQACTTTFPPITDIGGMTLSPGVYCFPSSAAVTGMLTLDAQGNPNAVFLFEIGSTLVTASASKVELISGAQPSNVFWQVGSSATLGTTTSFAGSIVALTSITATTAATLSCGLYALHGAVALDSNSIQTGFSLAFTSAATATTTDVVHGTNSFSFPTTVFDLRNSGAGWRLEAASAGLTLHINGMTTTIPLAFTSSTATCTPTTGQESTCVTPTFHPITLSSTPQSFLTTGPLPPGNVISGTFHITTYGTFPFTGANPAGTYTGSITITLVNAAI